MRHTILMVLTMILGPELSALTKVSKAELPLFFEVANAQSADFSRAHTTPCNYMYITDDDTLLYYGTTNDCRARMQSHNSPITSANEVVAAYDKAILLAAPREADGIQRAVREAAIRTDPAPLFNSDPCLGIMLARGRVTIWERRFNSADEAGEFEACVLGQRSQDAKDANGFPVNGIKGNCNRTVQRQCERNGRAGQQHPRRLHQLCQQVAGQTKHGHENPVRQPPVVRRRPPPYYGVECEHGDHRSATLSTISSMIFTAPSPSPP